jgi:hypothetical protein
VFRVIIEADFATIGEAEAALAALEETVGKLDGETHDSNIEEV